MYEAVPMDLAERGRQANGDAQNASQAERLPLVPLKDPIQRLTARVCEYEDRPSFVTSKRERPSCPCWIEFSRERVFVLEPPETLGRRLFCRECYCQDRRWVAMLTTAVKGEVRAFPEGLQHVPGRLGHGGHHRRHGCWLLHYFFLAIGRNGSANTDRGGCLARIRFNWLGIVASTDPSFDFAGVRMIQSNLQWPSFSPLAEPSDRIV
jgi:hypothetical protein